jgi:hypothetical protein
MTLVAAWKADTFETEQTAGVAVDAVATWPILGIPAARTALI